MRVAVRGEAWSGSEGGSAGPFRVSDTRRGRDDVAVSLGVVTFGFSGAAMTGVAGVAGVDFRDGLFGDGAGAARGMMVVLVVVIVRGAGSGAD